MSALSARKIALLSGAAGPSLDLNLLSGLLDPRITFTRGAGSATYFDAAGTLQTAGTNVARFDNDPVTHAPLGLLVEEARTNGIRNNTMVGAVAATPGTNPTNWAITNNVGLSQTIVGTGVESGIAYIDYRFFGTASGSGVVGPSFDTGTAIVAANAQVWTQSIYLRLVGGSLALVSAIQLGMDENTGAGAFIKQDAANVTTPTGAALASQRSTSVVTLSGGGTVGAITPWLRANISGAGAVDFTVRIGLPQCELGALATSPIPTTGAAATRPADVPTMPTGAWFNPVEGTIAAEYFAPFAIASGAQQGVLRMDDSTDANEANMFLTANSGVATSFGQLSSANTLNVGFVNAIGAVQKQVIAYGGGTWRSALNGGAVSSNAASGSFPATRVLFGRSNATAAWFLNGYIRRVRYWPRVLSASELRAVTR